MQNKNSVRLSPWKLGRVLLPIAIASILIVAGCVYLDDLICPTSADQGTTFWIRANGTSYYSGEWQTPNSGGMSVMLPENMEVLQCCITANPYEELVMDGSNQDVSYKNASTAERPPDAGYQWWSYSTGKRDNESGNWSCSLEVAVNDQAAGNYTLWFHGVDWSQSVGTRVRFEEDRPFEVVEVAQHDVGVSALTAPTGDQMWNDEVYPQVTVENFGGFTESFDVRVIITDGITDAEVYNQTEAVTGLASGDDIVVDFATAWTATPLGTYHVVAQTELGGDEEAGNDMMEDDFDVVPNHDVGVTVLTSPAGTIGENTDIYPKVTVENFGDVAEDFDVRVIITDGITDAEVYNETEAVTALGAGDDVVVDFATAWTATPLGTYHVEARAELSGDITPGNDTMEHDFDVIANHDVGVTVLTSPAGTVGGNTEVYPQVTVENFGNSTEDFEVRVIITDYTDAEVYNQIEAVTGLASGTDLVVNFVTAWTATPLGTYHVKAQTELSGDDVPGNDMKEHDFDVVENHDVGVTILASPAGTVGENTKVYPQVTVENFGDFTESFDVRVIITDGTDAEVYNQTEAVTGLAASDDVVVEFATAWTATPQATYHVVTRTELSGDAEPGNDMMEGDFEVGPPIYHDVGVTAIPVPAGVISQGRTIYPKVRVHNYGLSTETFDVRVVITGPDDAELFNHVEQMTDLGSGRTEEFEFSVHSWTADAYNVYHVTASTELVADEHPENDARAQDFRVGVEWPEGWHEVEPMPYFPTARQVKYGGWLALGPDANGGNEVIYVAKGYKTTDFYKYLPDEDTWNVLADIPASEEYKPGKIKTKPGKKGCKGVSDGAEAVYMTRGANLLGFWRYDIGADTWTRMEDVPYGPSGKRVKYGNDMVYVFTEDTGWIYLLKGYRTEFFRYNTVSGEWDTTLPEVPWGRVPKYKNGSFLVYDGDNTIYAHQSRYYNKLAVNPHHSMFKYDIASNTWDSAALKGIPVYGLEKGKDNKRKKSKDGACGAWYNGKMYAFKGGNTHSFWKYYPANDSWTQLREDTLPQYTVTTGKKRRVKYGADLVAYEGGALFALKGNKTLEMWRYGIRPEEVAASNRPGVMAGEPVVHRSSFIVSPNPIASGFATLKIGGQAAKWSSGLVRVYDIAGRCVLTRPLGHSTTGPLLLDCRRLSSGVYLVRLDADCYSTTQKLLVQR